MASDVISLQGSAGSVTVAPLGLKPPAVDSLDDLGMEVIKCCEGLDLQQVRAIHEINWKILLYFYINLDMDIPANRC